MNPTERRTYSVHAIATPDAVERAKAMARLEGFTVVTVALVIGMPWSWSVTLIVRSKEAA